MTDFNTNPTTEAGGRTLTAFFDQIDKADAAHQRLIDLGIPGASIRITGGDDYVGRADYREDRGFWDGLLDFFFPSEDAATYAEGLRRGGYLMTVAGVSSDQYDRVLDILDYEGSVDLDERATSWRREGWGGTDGLTDNGADIGDTSAGSSMGAGASASGFSGTASPDRGTLGKAGWREGQAATSRTGAGTGDETIPVIEERLRVGKRDVNVGRVRVRSYVVEEPASAEVSLRQERVEVERRPVDRPVGAGENDPFVDRTIEAEEHAEEAVIGKEARVTEEIGLRREAEERTETVSDTVRRTEVEVEDDRDSDAARKALRDKELSGNR